MSSSNCCYLTCTQISQETGKVVRYSHLFKNFPQFVVIHTVKGFNIVSEAEVDIFLEFSCFFYDSAGVGNLIFGSSAFSKPSLYVWKFLVHVVLKLSWKDFEHNLASIWNEHNCIVVWTSLTLSFFGIRMKTDLFQSSGHCWVFKIGWHIYCSILIASCFRIWNSSAGIPSPSLALLIIMFPKAQVTSYLRMSDSRRLTTPLWSSQSLRHFCIVLLCILATFSFYLFCFS